MMKYYRDTRKVFKKYTIESTPKTNKINPDDIYRDGVVFQLTDAKASLNFKKSKFHSK